MRTYIRTGNKGEKVLSYDENFRKWQKSGESKTPGGVKIGIFRFIAVLLLCVSTSPLWADSVNSVNFKCACITDTGFDSDDSCSQYQSQYDSLSGDTPEQKCKAVAGCKYNNTGCGLGDAGQYTVSGSGSNCSPDNSLHSFSGSYAQNQCFKKLDGNVSDGMSFNDLPKCKNASGGDVSDCLYYPGIGSNGCVVCPTSSNEQIGLMNKCTDSINVSNYINQSTDYHIEVTGDNAKCYSNTRNCNLFTTSGTVDGVSGEAEWKLRNTNNQTYGWDVVNCKKQEEYNGNNCEGIEIESPSISCNTISDCHSWVQNATSDITYNNNSGYYCKSCNAGYEVNNSTDANNQTTCSTSLCTNSSSANTCEPDSDSQVYICKCGAINRGYYRDSVVDLCDNNNNCKRSFSTFLGLFNGDVNQPCGPGQTTNGGATSEADCHYTTQTRFCDAHGCFYLSGLGWNATNGYTWGGATSTTSGQ